MREGILWILRLGVRWQDLEVDTSFASRRVTRVLETDRCRVGHAAGDSLRQRSQSNRSSFSDVVFRTPDRVTIIQPARPMQNAQVESFHGKLRDECLRVSWSGNLFEARRKIESWRTEYNQERPHRSPEYRTPEEFACEMRGEKSCEKTVASPNRMS